MTNRKLQNPLIVLVNDDGIQSPGIRAMARAVMPLGEVLIVAPREQQTSMGRAFRGGGVAAPVHYEIDGTPVRAFAVDGSPAVAVRYAALLLADRPPTLFVSGINYGENIGNGVTISGTVCAAIEAASMGYPALAVSLALHTALHYSHDDSVDFSMAAEWGKRFARRMLTRGKLHGADVVNVNVPQAATRKTPWRWTRISNQNFYRSTITETPHGPVIDGYELNLVKGDHDKNSDVRAILIDHVVSVSPITMNLTARVSKSEKMRWGK